MTTAALEQLAELVHSESGIRVDQAQHTALRAALARAAPGVDPATFLQRAADPVAGRDLVATLIDEVTVKETTFLRDRRQLETIAWRLLLENAEQAGSREIRVWSAGCATGEEAYSLALLAAEAFAPAEPPVRVLGTDISRNALAAAAAARYRPRAVRELDEPLLRRYFGEEEDGTYAVGERLRSLVELRGHNLVRDLLPPLGEQPFDLVVCRNVAIYFDVSTVERVVDGLERSVRGGGMLVIGAADALCATASRLAAIGVQRQPSGSARPPLRALRRPLGRHPAPPSRDDVLAATIEAANRGRSEEALSGVAALLAADPLDADAYFLRGMVQLESGDAAGASASLRRVLYVDPAFALAAFTLGRAHDAAGDDAAARRAYAQALRTLEAGESDDERHELLLQQIDVGDVEAACRTRLRAAR